MPVIEDEVTQELTARGLFSRRAFEPNMAGGPIRSLSASGVRITAGGIDVIERHLARFPAFVPNEQMLERLRRIVARALEPTVTDLNFYTHELREYVRYRRLGWATGEPTDPAVAYALWNNAHTAALEDYKLREGFGVLYHPDIHARYPELLGV